MEEKTPYFRMSLNCPWKRPEKFTKEADRSMSLELLEYEADIHQLGIN